ncbi:MAG: hypothetical protein ACMUIS_01585 [bacterium]
MRFTTYCILLTCTALFLFSAAAPPALAVGTLAGTPISNKATATYTVGTVTGLTKDSNTYTLTVDELINVDVTWEDASAVVVTPGATSRVLTFLVTNTGNGPEGFTLSALSTITGDDFDPTLVNIFFDDNENGVYDAGETQYQVGTNDPSIAADANVTVFVLNNIPLDPNDGETGDSRLTVTSKTGTGAGEIFEGDGQGGTDAVIGFSGGTDNATGTYLVSGVIVSIVKSAQILDPFETDRPVPGATITYSIVVTVTGSGTAKNVIIEDPIPAATEYVAGTLKLNTAPLSDEEDEDAGDVGVTKPNTVTVKLGELTSASETQTISFKVTID